MRAAVGLAEKVTRGKRTGCFLSGGSLRGNVDVLQKAVQIGNRSLFNPNAMCGRSGQVLFDVGTRSPAMRFSSLPSSHEALNDE